MTETRCSFSAHRFAHLLLTTNPAELNTHSTGTEQAEEDKCNSASFVSVSWLKVSQFFISTTITNFRNSVATATA